MSIDLAALPVAPPTVGAALARHAAARPDADFVVCDDERLTYATADAASRALARGLLGAGVGRGERVAILFPTGTDFVVTWLAVARIGAVAVPVSTFSTADELGQLVRGARVGTVVTVAGHRGNDYVAAFTRALPGLDLAAPAPVAVADAPFLRRVVVWGGAAGVEAAHTDAALRVAGERVPAGFVDRVGADVGPDDPMVIVHTSGSTSAPKGVVHSHGGLLAHLAVLNAARGLAPGRCLFSTSPFFWIGGMGYLLVGTLEAGSTLICSRADDPGAVLDLLERERPDLVNGFAQTVAALAAHPSFPQRDLSSIVAGNLYPIMPAALRPAEPELRHNLLGMTELGSVGLMDPDESDQPEHRRGSFGRPVADLEARVVDPETGADVAVGASGELWLRGPNLMDGYDGRERHGTFTSDGWFRTGDGFRADADGYLYFEGRRGDMIKTAGANVSPREVEGVLRDVVGCELAIVFGLPDPERGQVVAAVLVEPPVGTPDDEALRRLLRDRLSAFKVPRRVLRITRADLPVLSSGKPDLPRLKACFDG